MCIRDRRPKPVTFAVAVVAVAAVTFFVLRALVPAPQVQSAVSGHTAPVQAQEEIYTAYYNYLHSNGPVKVTVDSGGHTVSQVLDFSHPTFTFRARPDARVTVERVADRPGNSIYTFREGLPQQGLPDRQWGFVSEPGTILRAYSINSSEFSWFLSGQGTPPKIDRPEGEP